MVDNVMDNGEAKNVTDASDTNGFPRYELVSRFRCIW
jgi:hypothetical protein